MSFSCRWTDHDGWPLRRARRIEREAERRLIEAGRRAAELRGTLESADC